MTLNSQFSVFIYQYIIRLFSLIWGSFDSLDPPLLPGKLLKWIVYDLNILRQLFNVINLVHEPHNDSS